MHGESSSVRQASSHPADSIVKAKNFDKRAALKKHHGTAS
jgi:hypothetical protein